MNATRLAALVVAASIFASAVITMVTVAVAGPTEDSVFGAFEAFCIWPINKPDETVAMLQDVGATPLDESAARPFLNSLPGRAWAMRAEGARECRVFGADASGQAVENLVGQHLRSTKFASNKLGSDTQTIFVVTYSDPAGGAELHLVVGITYPDLASVSGAWIFAIPERLLPKELPRLPPWP